METSLIEYIIGGVLLIIALVLITIIMLQQSKKKGLSGAISGSSSNESYFGKNRAKTKERFYSKLTAILGT
ncbi:MAG TPA: preprotein translocase subunit SecG, partial [Clostridiales bacterium]|nr:preprotein translocase subunit SecG [Clostridiales bacterium]